MWSGYIYLEKASSQGCLGVMNGILCSTHVHHEEDVKWPHKRCITCYLWGKTEENQDESVIQLLSVRCWIYSLGC